MKNIASNDVSMFKTGQKKFCKILLCFLKSLELDGEIQDVVLFESWSYSRPLVSEGGGKISCFTLGNVTRRRIQEVLRKPNNGTICILRVVHRYRVGNCMQSHVCTMGTTDRHYCENILGPDTNCDPFLLNSIQKELSQRRRLIFLFATQFHVKLQS